MPVSAKAADWSQPNDVSSSALGQGTPWSSSAVQPHAWRASRSARLRSAATARNSGPVSTSSAARPRVVAWKE